jgi:hypothetical protein
MLLRYLLRSILAKCEICVNLCITGFLKLSTLKGISNYSTNFRKTQRYNTSRKMFKDFRVDLCVQKGEAQKNTGTLVEDPRDCERA